MSHTRLVHDVHFFVFVFLAVAPVNTLSTPVTRYGTPVTHYALETFLCVTY